MNHIEYITRVTGVIAIVLIIAWFLEIHPDIFRLQVWNVADPLEGIAGTTLFLWRNRFIDTLVQGIVILAGLLGVLAYVLWGESE